MNTRPLGLIIGLLIGLPVMAVGVVGLATHMDATPPSSFLKFFIGGDLVHDAIVVPIAAGIGYLVLRRTPAFARAPVRFAFFTSAVVLAIAWPAVRGYGRMRAPDNTSVQPLNYATAVVSVIAVVLVMSAVWLGALALSSARRSPDRESRRQR